LFGHIKPLTDELQLQYFNFRDKTWEGLEIWLIKSAHIRLPEIWHTGGTEVTVCVVHADKAKHVHKW